MKIIVVVLSICLGLALYMYITKETVVDNTPYENKIEALEKENASLLKYYNDTLKVQDSLFKERIKIKDSIIGAKLINNWNLIVKHEKELEKYNHISTDSIYMEWVRVASSE